MVRANHLEAIAQLSESEGVFTTAQAERMGIRAMLCMMQLSLVDLSVSLEVLIA